jgi:UDP-N-acetylmuramoyl-tripeptide--D-alanyl-D-alanine ligase
MLDYTSVEKLYDYFISADQLVSTDTRNLERGAIFFALKGENFNANKFAQQAIDSGCSYAVVDEAEYAIKPNIVLVENVLKSLQHLANFHRNRLNIPVLAITGSNAKTTHKELIHAVLSKKFKAAATIGNLNNHIGVPLTLLNIRPDHEFAIIEMGANHQGEIEDLCTIANPDFGLITNIGKAHLEGFGGIEGVKKGKSELYKFLKAKNCKTFINGDDDVLFALATDNDKITYGCNKLYDVIGKDFNNSQTVSFKYTTRYGEKDWDKLELIKTQIVGSYNFINLLAAACVGHYFKVEAVKIKAALEEYIPTMNRSQLVKSNKNTILLDAYNANPNSMRVAIENFYKYKAEKKLLLLGDMFELGEYSGGEHQKIVDLLISSALNNVILVGQEFFRLEEDNFLKFKTTVECKEYLQTKNILDTTILIKGSRGMKMEILMEVL